MGHVLVGVVDFEIVGPYTLSVTFDDGTSQTIDFEPVLYGYYFAPLRDRRVFNQVRLDPEVHTLVWPNDADFDPATLYNWNRGEGAESGKKGSALASEHLGEPRSGVIRSCYEEDEEPLVSWQRNRLLSVGMAENIVT